MKLSNAGGDCFSVVRLEMQVEQELEGNLKLKASYASSLRAHTLVA